MLNHNSLAPLQMNVILLFAVFISFELYFSFDFHSAVAHTSAHEINDTVVWINSFNHANSTVHTQWLRISFFLPPTSLYLSFSSILLASLPLMCDFFFSCFHRFAWVDYISIYSYKHKTCVDIFIYMLGYGILPVHAHCRRTWTWCCA